MPHPITSQLMSLAVFICLFFTVSYGQKTEINVDAYSGLSFFRGNGSTSNSLMYIYETSNPGALRYTANMANTYGRGYGFSYATELQVQHITKGNYMYGAGISWESLKSRVNINTVYFTDYISPTDAIYLEDPASGKATLQNNFITLNPFIGHRYSFRRISLDVLAGVDLGFCLLSKSVGKALDGGILTARNSMPKPSIDYRPRIQVKVQKKRYGIITGYSLGMTNYQSRNNGRAYSNFLRLGLSYELR